MGNPASEKTESATQRRRDKEKEKGNIARSQDLSAALMITAGVAILGILAAHTLSNLETLLRDTFSHLDPNQISSTDILRIIMPFITSASNILLPFLITLTFVGIAVMRMQVGHVFAPDKIKFDMENISPSKIMQNAKKTLNPVEPRNMVEFIKSILKLIIVGACGFSVLNGRKNELIGLLGLNITSSFAVIASILTQMLVNMCLAMLAIGLLDKKYQDYEYEKSIKMTKQEIKDEYKDTEGDPKIKARLRSIQMKIARQRMMANVQKADVIVTNPTHYAVALQYDRLKTPAPKVVAKGVDFVAFKIREIGQNNNIPIVENPPLARELYKLVPIDGIIPSDMFVAVAEVLAYVYNKNKGG